MLNKFMHPRNIYKNRPDFSKLAKSYEEFSSIAKVDVTGKVYIDFKDANSLRILTKCLLKSDFNLDVVIPEDRLVPTLPLRLNYILWIEDLMNSIRRLDNVKGLDIGTGACAIYPLLAATKNTWQMVGTETDDVSLQLAKDNVRRNNLQRLIQLKKNPTKSIFEFLFKEGCEKFDFCMCNPPFYSNLQELCESRSPARLPPKNGFTGSPQELITEGGELSFCRLMIQESKLFKESVQIFTTMIGHKCNLRELCQDLKADGVKHTTSEFCQGRVTRWGLAWTYQNFDLATLVPGRDKARKKGKPVVFLLPEVPELPYDIESMTTKLRSMLEDLKIVFKVINKRGNSISFDIRALENTWSNQRRKRRLMKRLQEDGVKKPKVEETCASGGTVSDTENQNRKATHPEDTIDSEDIATNNKTVEVIYNNEQNEESVSNLSEPNDTALSDTNPKISIDPVVHAFLKLFKRDSEILLETEFLDGSAGKEGLHQIIQYIKNNWK